MQNPDAKSRWKIPTQGQYYLRSLLTRSILMVLFSILVIIKISLIKEWSMVDSHAQKKCASQK